MTSPRRYIASASKGTLVGPDFEAECVFGKAGLVEALNKREGDKASPIGIWPVRRALFRPDRLTAPDSDLRIDPIAIEDGWCDDPSDPAYNRPVVLPYAASHEVLTRDDGLYDLIVVLGHNDDPPVPGLGSAIFLHCQRTDKKPTLGCLALEKDNLIKLLSALRPGDEIEISH